MTASPEAAGERRRRRAAETGRPLPPDGGGVALPPRRRRVRRLLDGVSAGRTPALLLVFLIAAALRLGPLLRTGSLTGVLGTDDGAYYSASAHLLRGLLPYRDVAFEQSPGIAVLLLPFTALALLAGDPVGMAAARVAVVLVGALNAVLVALFLRRYAPPYAVAGGLAYAAWRLTAAAERSVHLEAFLTCGLLTSLILLGSTAGTDPAEPAGTGTGTPTSTGPRAGPRPRRVAASGAVLGLTAATTLWAVPAALLVTVYLLATRATRAAALWAGGVLAGFAALAGPLIVVAPSSFGRQAVGAQLFAGTEATTSERFRRFADLARFGEYVIPESIEVMAATCVVVAVAAAAFAAWWQPGARLAALLVPLQCLLVVIAPDYRFGRFAAAPTLVIALFTAVHRLAPRPWAGRPGPVAAVVTTLGLTAFALTAVHNVVPRPSDVDPLRAFVSGQRHCVWFDTASLAITADGLTDQLERGCPAPVDRLADFRELVPGAPGDPEHEARHSSTYQVRLGAELADADAAVLPADDDVGVLGDGERDDQSERFTEIAEYETITLWIRRR